MPRRPDCAIAPSRICRGTPPPVPNEALGASIRQFLKTITIGRDRGSTIEIASGLSPEDRVIESAPDGIVDGDRVRVKETSNPAAAR